MLELSYQRIYTIEPPLWPDAFDEIDTEVSSVEVSIEIKDERFDGMFELAEGGPHTDVRNGIAGLAPNVGDAAIDAVRRQEKLFVRLDIRGGEADGFPRCSPLTTAPDRLYGRPSRLAAFCTSPSARAARMAVLLMRSSSLSRGSTILTSNPMSCPK